MPLRAEVSHDGLGRTRVVHMVAEEGLCELFDISFDVVLDDPNLDCRACLWTPASIEIFDGGSRFGNQDPRFFHGVIEAASYVGSDRDRHMFRFRLRPTIRLLAHRVRSRIFQQESVPEIVWELLGPAGVNAAWNVGTYPIRDYVTQWKESELDFALRLLQEAGIVYRFEHGPVGHVLRLSDTPQDYVIMPGVRMFEVRQTPREESEGRESEYEAFFAIKLRGRFTSDAFTHRDWNYLTPKRPTEGHEIVDETGACERYEYPGRFESDAEGEFFAKNRLLEIRQRRYSIEATTPCHRLVPGQTFVIAKARPGLLVREYLTTRVHHEWSWDPDQNVGGTYRASIEAIPAEVEFRPPRSIPIPRIAGKESAVVTGPPGEEIHVDPLGRIKAHFYWDRENPRDDSSSCWIRCQQQNTSRQMLLPRVGWEMSIGFVNGDPDRPIALQKLYNSQHAPAYPLPGSLAQSALKSASSPGGGGSNEVRFNDSNGAQEFYLHSQKNLDVHVGHDRVEDVAVNASRDVHCNDTLTVAMNETYRVGANQRLSIAGKAVYDVGVNRTATVGIDNWTISHVHSTVVGRDRSEDIRGMMTVLAARTAEVFNKDHEAEILGIASRVVTSGAYVEAVGGNKSETTAGAKIELIDQTKAENIGLGKVLNAGTVSIETGADLSYDSWLEFNLRTGGPYTSKVVGDVSISGKAIKITASAKADLTVAGNRISLAPAKTVLKGKKVGLGGKVVKVRGKVSYKKPGGAG